MPSLIRTARVALPLILGWFLVYSLWGKGIFDRAIHQIELHGPTIQLLRLPPSWVPMPYQDPIPPLSTTRSICHWHGWKPFRPKTGVPRKVYDLFMINTELDWLEIRLNTTYDYVDYFIIVEAAKTFTGKDKPLTVNANLARFAQYSDKIIYHLLEDPPSWDPKRPWDREDFQRDAMFAQVFPRLTGDQAPNWGDAILVADVDEIPRPEALRLLRLCRFPRRLTLRSQFYYYSFQFLHRGPEWGHPEATFYEGPKTVRPSNLRIGDGGFQPFIFWDKGTLWNAGWHCSSCFSTIDELLTKMGSFSHVSYNADEYRDRNRIADRVRNGKDLWDRADQIYDRIENNTDVPQYLLDHPDRFRYLLNRDGDTAGFTDYP